MARLRLILLAILLLLTLMLGLTLIRDQLGWEFPLITRWTIPAAAMEGRLVLLEQEREAERARAASVRERLDQALERLTLLEAQPSGAVLAQRLAEWEGRPALRLEAGQTSLSSGEMNWELGDLLTGRRRHSETIRFERPFEEPPQVLVGLSQLIFGEGRIHLETQADPISAEGFTLVLETRVDSRFREARINWVAFGK